MQYYSKLTVILFLLFSLVAEAQTDVSIKKKEFDTGNTGFAEAWKHVREGDKFYSQGGASYAKAFDEYLQAIVYNNSNPELNYKTGISALFSDHKEEASGFLLNSLEFNPNVTGDVLFFTGWALQYNNKFEDAVAKFNEYKSSADPKHSGDLLALADKHIDECNSAMNITRDTLRIKVTNPGPAVNSESDDYSEILTADAETMYFASRRQTGRSFEHSDMKYDENIYVTHNENGAWGTAAPAGKDITTKYCEAPLFINKTGDRLYIYEGSEREGDIMVSEKKNGLWRTPGKPPYPVNSAGSETSFCISPGGNEIYFVSDNGKVNQGGKDIYFIKMLNGRKWSKPVNAGSMINTKYDEENVVLSGSGDTLWFSSKGHNTIGGFDIFYCVRGDDGEWGEAKNCGYPVNSVWDDLFFCPSPLNDSIFYFASNRSGGTGGLDIYEGRLLPEIRETIPVPKVQPDTVIIRDTVVVKEPEPAIDAVVLEGRILDSETGEPVLARIDVTDLLTDSLITTTASSDTDGSYRAGLPAKKAYNVSLKAAGYLSDMKQVVIPPDYEGDKYTFNATLIKVKVGKRVVLNNILFETGKAVLTKSSFSELDHLLEILKDNPNMKIEISGHTDNTGSAAINTRLSGERAKTVVDYLTGKGIDRTRLTSKGYGSTQPVADNSTAQGRAKNRRVEFKILEF
jgi:outer membrane protein OmpA-like peptidoglycan-associated protein